MPERPVLKFAVAGAAGFLTDATLLMAAVKLAGMDPLSARVVSFTTALGVTYTINRTWAFAARPPSNELTGFCRYVTVQLGGAAVNLAAYAATLVLVPALEVFPVAALAVGSFIGMTFNYIGAKHVVFGR